MGSFCSRCMKEEDEEGSGNDSVRQSSSTPLLAPLETGDQVVPQMVEVNVTTEYGTMTPKSERSTAGASHGGHSAGFHKNKRGLKLWEQEFAPMKIKPNAVVLFLHGLHEHSGRYDDVFDQIAEETKTLVRTFDAMSHGQSENLRGFRGACDSMKDFVDDAEDALERIHEEYPDLPVYLWGHGFGGLVACFVVLRSPSLAKGLVLTSPTINIDWTLTARLQARAASIPGEYTPDLPAMAPVDIEKISIEENVREEYAQDPLNNIEPLRCRLGAEILKAYKDLADSQGDLTIEQVLVMIGDQDDLSNIRKTKDFFAKLQCEKKSLKEFPGKGYSLFHELGSEKVVTALTSWLTSALAFQPTSTTALTA